MISLLDPVFTDFLMIIGDVKKNSEGNDLVSIPLKMFVETNDSVDGLNVLIKHVYPNLFVNSINNPSNLNQAILTTKTFLLTKSMIS